MVYITPSLALNDFNPCYQINHQSTVSKFEWIQKRNTCIILLSEIVNCQSAINVKKFLRISHTIYKMFPHVINDQSSFQMSTKLKILQKTYLKLGPNTFHSHNDHKNRETRSNLRNCITNHQLHFYIWMGDVHRFHKTVYEELKKKVIKTAVVIYLPFFFRYFLCKNV